MVCCRFIELCIPPCPVDCIALEPVEALPDPNLSRTRHLLHGIRVSRIEAERAAQLEAWE